MRNTLEELNNHLFESMERLNDDDLTGEDLTETGLNVVRLKIKARGRRREP